MHDHIKLGLPFHYILSIIFLPLPFCFFSLPIFSHLFPLLVFLVAHFPEYLPLPRPAHISLFSSTSFPSFIKFSGSSFLTSESMKRWMMRDERGTVFILLLVLHCILSCPCTSFLCFIKFLGLYFNDKAWGDEGCGMKESKFSSLSILHLFFFHIL